MNFLGRGVRLEDVDPARNLHNELLVQGVELLEIFEGDEAVARLPPGLNCLETLFGRFRQEDVQVGLPPVPIVKVVVRPVMRSRPLGLGPFPKDPTRAQKAALVDARAARPEGPQDRHVQREYSIFRIFIKLLEGPLVNRLTKDDKPFFLERPELGRLTRPDVAVDDHLHLLIIKGPEISNCDQNGWGRRTPSSWRAGTGRRRPHSAGSGGT